MLEYTDGTEVCATSDWTAIYNTPDSRIYKRLTNLGWSRSRGVRRPEPTDELLLFEADES